MPASAGAPVNQEDLLITMSAFSIEVIKALAKMGIHLSEEEKEAWCHLWFVTAYLLGSNEDLIPTSYAACEQMSNRILADQARRSASGLVLVGSCVEFMADLLPFRILAPFSYSVFKYINEDEYREMMGLTQRHKVWDWVMPKLMKSTLGIDQKMERRSPLLKFVITSINTWLINGLLKMVVKNEKFFFLPTSLKR